MCSVCVWGGARMSEVRLRKRGEVEGAMMRVRESVMDDWRG